MTEDIRICWICDTELEDSNNDSFCEDCAKDLDSLDVVALLGTV